MPLNCTFANSFLVLSMVNKISIKVFWVSLVALILLNFYRLRIEEVGLAVSPICIQLTFLMNVIITFCGIILFTKRTIHSSSSIKILLILAFVYIFYSQNEVLNRFFDVNIYTALTSWIFIYLFFFSFFSTQSVTIKLRDRFIVVFTLLFCILFFVNYFTRLGIGVSWSFIESYYMLTMIPFIMLLRNTRIKNALLFIIFISIIVAAKRTGVLVISVCLLLYFFHLFYSKNTQTRFKLILFILLVVPIIFVVIVNVLGDEFNYTINRMMAIREDGGSGRADVYKQIYSSILHSTGNWDFLFGHGYNSVKQLIGYSAHNDFLEVLYDFGFIVFCIYMAFVLSIINKCRKRNLNYEYKFATLLSMCIFLILSFFSHMIFFSNSIMCLCAFWGYIDARIKSDE